MAADRENELPDWMSPAGGKKKWADWIERQAARCRKRARDWYASRKQTATVATTAEWRLAILNAAKACGGRGHFSQLPLSLELPATDARYPSLEHLRGPADCTVAIELRVVNDMKTILSEAEFRDMLGHLVHTLSVPPVQVADDWCCARDFGGPEGRLP
ncbi:MAG: hypothetical protein JNL79_38165 [Myxococcales bacterium]|nr:hypothetical protein [Myxococcales bacterium]